MTTNTKKRAASWGRYWAGGNRHSCSGSFSDHYGPATRVFWSRCFARLSPDDRVLELGCGNGSLFQFLLESMEREAIPNYDAVDLAPLDMRFHEALPADVRKRLRVYPETEATVLLAEPGRFSRVYAHFALEYFENPEIWKALNRTLTESAEISLVVHHAGSILHRTAAAEKGHCDWLLEEGGALDCAEAILPHFFQRSQRPNVSPSADALLAKARFNAVFSELEKRAATLPVPDVLHDLGRQVMTVLSDVSRAGLDSSIAKIGQLRRSIDDNALRVGELCDSALTPEAMKNWEEHLRKLGMCRVSIEELHENGQLFGWTVDASRS